MSSRCTESIRRTSRLTAVLLTAVLSLTTLDLPSSAANAAEPAERCAPTNPKRCVLVYPEADFAGTPQQIEAPEVNSCVTLTPPLSRATGSVLNQLPRTAALFHAGAGCTGASYRFGAGSSAKRLTNVGFSKAVSVKFVEDECRSAQRRVCLFADAEFAGDAQFLPRQTTNTCLKVNTSLRGRVSSVWNLLLDFDTTPRLQQDILLFTNDNCTGDAERFNASTGHPDLEELRDVNLENRALSVKFVQDPCEYGTSLCLWADVLYDGVAQVIPAQPADTCITLRPELRGQVSSLRNQLYHPVDRNVVLFTGDNCTGTSQQFNAARAEARLSKVNFDNKARSVRFL